MPIVGCEPSCLLTLREEHLGLLPGDPRARRSPRRRGSWRSCWSRRSTTARCALRADADVAGRPILFHGHCHQKALAGTAATVALLERIPGAEVTELDAGCCGMAGSFGFEAEHYDLSMQIGEQRLFPALREPRRARWSPPPACRAASRSATAWGSARGILSSS